MRADALSLESQRMQGKTVATYQWKHERHRICPEIFENRNHQKILDISAGIGVVAKNVVSRYSCSMVCNELDATCLKELKELGVAVVSADIDSGRALPWKDGGFDAVICLATLEHLINLDWFVNELHRIVKETGRLYLSVPNYASLYWMIPLLRGRTFHDPFGERSRYEFYAHIRYFTYQTLTEFMEHFGFSVDTVYLPLPEGSTRMQEIRNRSTVLALGIKGVFRLLYSLSPRWHQEPVICFQKGHRREKIRRVIL